MTYQLDTSGVVLGETGPNGKGGVQPDGAWTWGALDPFTQGYTEALFADTRSAYTEAADGARVMWPVCAFSDLAPETLARIIADCEAYIGTGDIVQRYRAISGDGARFWKDRAGGWIPTFPPLNVQLGDDGKVGFQ